MLSTSETPRFLVARPGGALLCLWSPSSVAAVRARYDLAFLRFEHPELNTIAYGSEIWNDPDMSGAGDRRVLSVVWCAREEVQPLSAVLSAHGDVIDYPGRLRITGQWLTAFGVPRIADTEYDQEAEVGVTVPAWLARMQQEAA